MSANGRRRRRGEPRLARCRRRAGVVVATCFLAWLAPACGGGGGGGGGPTQPTPQLVFTAQGTPAAGSVYLASGAASTAASLLLEVRAQQVTDLYGVAFDLDYPATVLRYVGATQGDLLSSGGAPTSFQAVEASSGRLVVGLSRLGSVAGASGSGLLLTLQFAPAGSGTGTFAWRDNSLFDSTGRAQSGVQWLSGSVQVVP